MAQLTLRRLFALLLPASLAPPVMLAACSSAPSTSDASLSMPDASLSMPACPMADGGVSGDGDPSLFTPPECTMSGSLAVTGLMPNPAVDYIELRESWPMQSVVAQSGTPCATAGNRAACAMSLSLLTGNPGFHGSYYTFLPNAIFYLATTRADEVRALGDPSAVSAFLAPVDTPQEAALIAFAKGYDLSCTNPALGGVRPAPSGDGYEVLATAVTESCVQTVITGFHLRVGTNGCVSVLGSKEISRGAGSYCEGRRPAGLCEATPERALTAVGAYFASTAHLEAASVEAFQRLHKELRLHGAPGPLLAAAERAAGDEVRHARLTAHLARRYGGTPAAVQVERRALRALPEVALENAVEGCVRETLGALIGAWQAQNAGDPLVAAAMGGIACDELRHAELAWAVARWAEPRLHAAARRRIRAAQQQALAEMRAELLAPPAPGLVELAGLPTSAQALALVDAMEQTLWA